MWIQTFFKSMASTSTGRRPTRRPAQRLSVDALENRTVPAFLAAVGYPVEFEGALVTADFNGDGRLDLATLAGYPSTLSVLLGNGDGTFQAARTSPFASGDAVLAVGDFDGNGKPDLATNQAVRLGNGDGTFGSPQWLPTNPPYSLGTGLAVGDLNSDGKGDLVGVNTDYGEFDSAGYAMVLLGNGDGTFTNPWTIYGIGNELRSVALADFDGDGRLDVATSAGVLLGNGDGTVRPPMSINSSGGDTVAVADFNGDGKPDLASIGYSFGYVSTQLGNGDGTLQPRWTYFATAYGQPLALADFNGDGKPDLATDRAVLLGNGDGTLRFSTAYDTGATFPPTSLAAADFNGDGRPDLATTISNAASVLINDANWPPLGAPSVSASDATLTEGNTGTRTATFTLTLSAAYGQPVTVAYATADGSATAGSDYQAVSGTLTIPAGQTTGTIIVLVNGDRLGEPNETFVVNLSSAANATIADGQGLGTILDDEPRISINDAPVTEGNTGTVNATFTVRLSVAYDVPVTVHYETTNGSATAGSDYAAASGDVTIAPGQTTKTFAVAVIGDRLPEPTENFVVNLSAATNGLIVDGQGVGTITDDEPRISIGDVTKAEGKAGQTTLFTFTVTLSAAYDQAVTMSFRTVDGTAKTSDNDYIAKTGTLTFAPGERTKTITIEVKGDSKREADETFCLDLYGLSGNGLFTKSRGVGTILNDD